MSSPAASAAPFTPSTEVELGSSYEEVTKGRDSWSSIYVEAVDRYQERKTRYGGLQWTKRFSREDYEFTAGHYWPVAEKTTSVVEASYSPTHRSLAKWSVMAQLEHILPHGWGIHLGLRHKEHIDTGVDMGMLTLERYWADYRGAYTFTSSRVHNDRSDSHRFQLTQYLNKRDYFGFAVSQGQELEFLPDVNATLSFDVIDLTFMGRYWFQREWAVNYSFTLHEQGDAYTRRGIRIGLRRLF